ncbi:peptidylprolyl isomerase [Mangrovimicrobium sediminis]|uniref:Periplasmic chaperone PpiD n=1 Tax=Mangrovimicrobium sediminis TaxID=2562682 RepID=A0A4Z0M2H5_9GAMM|nr:SurA N-terminal domain-containing protein [Haliea sp. SAOS-164]TGD73656.1 peptidylprolyl isomerase [Haliea sp. SAOS-164]
MLQDIRKSTQGTTAKIIVGLIVLAFAFWGVESILLGGSSNAVAEINGEEVSPVELQQAINVERRRLVSQSGGEIDPALLEEEALTQGALQDLIARKLMLQSARERGMTVSNAQIGAVIAGMPQFQIDGVFSEDLYRAALGEAGYSPNSFRMAVHDDMLLSQLRSGLAASEFATPAELATDASIIAEMRDIRFLTVGLEAFQDVGEIAEGDIEAYYDANAESFRTPESVDLNYIELRAEDYRQPVDEDALRVAFEQELQNAGYQTESRVSHIMLVQGADESDDAYAQRIAEVQAKLDAGGDFAELAAEYSDDPGSAASGGDLGYTAGDVFPEPMEEAIAVLEPERISAPVTTDSGTHFLLVTERREAAPPSFEELRPQLEHTLAMDAARDELLRVVEALKDLAFNAEDLSGPAEELDLEVSEVEGVTRDQSEGLFANDSLRQAAFSDEVLGGGMNSDVIELSPEEWVVLRVREHHDPEVLPLAEVREQIVAQISQERALAAAEQAAQRAAAAVRAGSSLVDYAADAGYASQVELAVNRTNTTMPRELLVDAFRLHAPAEGESSVSYVAAAGGGFYVYELARVTPGSLAVLPEIQRESLRRLISGEYGSLIDSAYRQSLREAADIEVML